MTRPRRGKRAETDEAGSAEAGSGEQEVSVAPRSRRGKRAGTEEAAVPAPPPPPERRRAVFIDVENTSSKSELMGALDGLTLDRGGERVEMSAIGNWRVVGQDLARALAERGAQLVHSAPVSRVSDWSDLWIAVSAGIWLGTARPGDVVEIVSHDRAFDAVGDAAARLGVTFRRITYRASGGAAKTGTKKRSRGRATKRAASGASRAPAPTMPQAVAGAEPVAASAEQLRQAIAVLMQGGAPDGVSLDALTRALKEAGFLRPPGSPRLVNRLRRLKDVEVASNGRVRLVGAHAPAPPVAAESGGDEAPPTRRRRSSRRRGGRRRGRRGKGSAPAT